MIVEPCYSAGARYVSRVVEAVVVREGSECSAKASVHDSTLP